MSKMRKFFKSFKKGFTLVEIVVVLALMALIAGIAVPNLSNVRTRAERDTYEASLALARSHVKSFVALMTAGETSYPVTENYKVKQYTITSAGSFRTVLNATNRQSEFEYYVVGYTDALANADPTAKVAADSSIKKDTIIPVIIKSGSTYSLKGLWYYSIEKQAVIYTYKTVGVASFYDGWVALGSGGGKS